MEFNLNAGRLRSPFAYMRQPSGSDAYGQPLPRTEVLRLWADIQDRSGSQVDTSGESMTSETINCLTYYNDRVLNSGWLRDLQTGVDYEIQHVRRGNLKQAMIITARINTK